MGQLGVVLSGRLKCRCDSFGRIYRIGWLSLSDKDTGSAEAIATRLTRLLSDSLAALGDTGWRAASASGSPSRRR